jgi:hypothetical protein
MIVQCVRCNTEFSSSHSSTHICPNCHFVFTEHDSQNSETELQQKALMNIVHSTASSSPGDHRLHEESAVKCAFHPDVDALAYCKSCGRPLCYACANEEQDGVFCDGCRKITRPPPAPVLPVKELAVADEAGEEKRETVSQAMSRGPYVAWEYRQQLGGLNAFLRTFRQSLFSPLRFFQKVPIVADYQSPLLYGVYWTVIGIAGGMFWRLAFWGYPILRALFWGEQVSLPLEQTQHALVAVFLFLISPLLGLIILLGACLLYHLFVKLATSRHAGFQSTLRVICYSTGTNIFFFLPLIGVLIGGVWHLVLVTIGLREIHRVPFPTAVTITLIPYTILLVMTLAFIYWAIFGNDFGLLDVFMQQMLRLL